MPISHSRGRTSGGIPKKIHIVWIGDESERPDRCIASWRDKNPDWQVVVWGNREFSERSWVNQEHMAARWRSEIVAVADMMRYEILFKEGGFCIDADSVCERPLDDYLFDEPVVLSFENEIERGGLLAVGYMASAPGDPFFERIIEDIRNDNSIPFVHAAWSTGPYRLTKHYQANPPERSKILPSFHFIPQHYTGRAYEGGGVVYGRQLWADTCRRIPVYRAPKEECIEVSATPAACLENAGRAFSSNDINAGIVFARDALRLSADVAGTERALSLLSVHGFYSNNAELRAVGAQSCERLLTGRAFSHEAKVMALRNSVWYTPTAAERFKDVTLRKIEIDPPSGWHLTNPSFCRHNGKIHAILRAVNYHITPEGYYITLNNDVERTRNFLVEMSDNFDVLSSREIMNPPSFAEPMYHRCLGVEDCRVFSWKGEMWASATVLQLNANGSCEIYLMRVNDDGVSCWFSDMEKIVPEGLPLSHEKNWMPFVEDDALFWVYSSDPTRIIDRHGKTVRLNPPDIRADTLRGGPSPVKTGHGWLTVMHHTIDNAFHRRVYSHRFVLFDERFNLRAYSAPFVFKHIGVEFASGLMLVGDDKVVVGLGVEDGESWTAEFSLPSVLYNLTWA